MSLPINSPVISIGLNNPSSEVVWVIQSNLIGTTNDLTADAVNQLGIKLIACQMVPFSHEYNLWEDPVGYRVIPYGSTTFIKHAPKEWLGLFFDEDQMRTSTWKANRPDMLNERAIITTFGEASKHMDDKQQWFIKPDGDLKDFTGELTTKSEFSEWADKIIGKGYTFDENLAVVVAPYIKIHEEYRFFVVGGEVIDGSLYKANGRLTKKHLEEDSDILFWAKKAARKFWLPHPCVCMDVGMTNEGPKIIEFNCINGSGWYDHDVNKVVKALTQYVREM